MCLWPNLLHWPFVGHSGTECTNNVTTALTVGGTYSAPTMSLLHYLWGILGCTVHWPFVGHSRSCSVPTSSRWPFVGRSGLCSAPTMSSRWPFMQCTNNVIALFVGRLGHAVHQQSLGPWITMLQHDLTWLQWLQSWPPWLQSSVQWGCTSCSQQIHMI